jgi:hypothetical protein
MDETEAPGVERLPSERDATPFAIRRIPDQRMSERGEVNADLVGSPGFEPASEQRAVAETFPHLITRDRGIFTRRAVKLLDRADTQAVTQRYNEDSEFRDQVHRYIHDFEALLRRVMATREGTPIATTMLSSDMGKLYVALAQAIERLRR